MRIKIKSIAKVMGEEELGVICLAENEYFIECLNFYEDVEGGRQARLVIVFDKFGYIDQNKINFIKGKKTYIEAEGVEEDFEKIRKVIKMERVARMYRAPLYLDIQIVDKPDLTQRGVKGVYNYLKVHKEIEINKLKGIINLELEELV